MSEPIGKCARNNSSRLHATFTGVGRLRRKCWSCACDGERLGGVLVNPTLRKNMVPMPFTMFLDFWLRIFFLWHLQARLDDTVLVTTLGCLFTIAPSVPVGDNAEKRTMFTTKLVCIFLIEMSALRVGQTDLLPICLAYIWQLVSPPYECFGFCLVAGKLGWQGMAMAPWPASLLAAAFWPDIKEI